MSVRTFATLAAAYNARYAPPVAGEVGSLAASADLGSIDAAGVRPYGATSGKLVYVKALEHFFVAGPTFIPKDDFVQVTEDEAKDLVRIGRAALASDADVAAAQAAAAATSKVK